MKKVQRIFGFIISKLKCEQKDALNIFKKYSIIYSKIKKNKIYKVHHIISLNYYKILRREE